MVLPGPDRSSNPWTICNIGVGEVERGVFDSIFSEAITSSKAFVNISEQAVAVLRAMRGRLSGRLEGDVPLQLDPGWNDPVPCQVAQELHETGFIEIDESAPIGDTYVFRISEAGMAYLDSNRCPPTSG